MDDLKEFIDQINNMGYEIGCLKDGLVGSHTMRASISMYDKDGNSYKITNINYDYLFGCGCPSGIELVIEKGD